MIPSVKHNESAVLRVEFNRQRSSNQQRDTNKWHFTTHTEYSLSRMWCEARFAHSSSLMYSCCGEREQVQVYINCIALVCLYMQDPSLGPFHRTTRETTDDLHVVEATSFHSQIIYNGLGPCRYNRQASKYQNKTNCSLCKKKTLTWYNDRYQQCYFYTWKLLQYFVINLLLDFWCLSQHIVRCVYVYLQNRKVNHVLQW